MKVLMILVDGMRPDMLDTIPQAQAMMKNSSYCLRADTVFPSVTLPCHMSLFHSVDPSRHGTTTNTYAPQVRPIAGLCEQLTFMGKKNAFFYSWHALRDLTLPHSLAHSCYLSGKVYGYESCNTRLTDAAIDYIRTDDPDFTFLYLGWVDEAGHAAGWLSEEYQRAVQNSWADIERITNTLPEDYTVIVLADHGGHERMHGTMMQEDMIIPIFLSGPDFKENYELKDVSIKDIAPTVAKLLGAPCAPEWEGKSLL